MKMKRILEFDIESVAKVLLLLTFLFWLITIYRYRGVGLIPMGDMQRDMAIIYHILNGGSLIGDASYLGEYAWYPYLSHLMVSAYQLATKIPVETLFHSYTFLLSFPAGLLFIFSVSRLFRSNALTLLAFFSLVFVFPMTTTVMGNQFHPKTLAMGVSALTIFLFWRATETKKTLDYLMAGAGIALVVYSQPYYTLTIGGGILLYQLWTRQSWQKFFLMLSTSFVLTAPYLLPLVFAYHLRPLNTTLLPFVENELSLDWIFYGFGGWRWLNCLLIMTGVLVALCRKNKLDKLLLTMFSFSLFFVVWGVVTSQVKPLNFLTPPKAIVWQDIEETNHFMAVFFFSIGLWYWLNQLPLAIKPRFPYKKAATLALFLFVLVFYAYLMIPRFVQKNRVLTYPMPPYSDVEDWQKTVAWIRRETTVNEAFLAHDLVAYYFIGGLTGRKVLVTNDHHSNPFVDQRQRVADQRFMLTTTDVNQFMTLAKAYEIDYVVASGFEEGLAGEGIKKFADKNYFRPAFISGPIKIYRLTQKRSAL